jgi:hypothetical protein
MPSQNTKSISLGSNEHGQRREAAYVKAAKGNLSRWLCELGDRALGLNLPLPGDRRQHPKGLNDGFKTKRSRRL